MPAKMPDDLIQYTVSDMPRDQAMYIGVDAIKVAEDREIWVQYQAPVFFDKPYHLEDVAYIARLKESGEIVIAYKGPRRWSPQRIEKLYYLVVEQFRTDVTVKDPE